MIEGKPAPLKKVGTMTVVDIETGEVLETRQNVMEMLPEPPGTCTECAWTHNHDSPHNCQSMFYQVRFYSTHGRYPTWADAMAHCAEELKQEWRAALIRAYVQHRLPVPPELTEPAGTGVRR